ncbi:MULTISPECIES: hypothetical protein [unclassified Streptomyces]|uniref:hypothetical protein n=1 Tax=unclassified Streptomyces TaxID=2593676 RepID=UPI0036A90C31
MVADVLGRQIPQVKKMLLKAAEDVTVSRSFSTPPHWTGSPPRRWPNSTTSGTTLEPG